MNRRDILKLSIVGLGAGLSAEADAAPGEDAAGAVARLRRRLERTSTLEFPFARVPTWAPPVAHERAAIDHTLIHSTMRTLLVTGAVMDMEDEARSHPDVRALLDEVSPEIDHAVEGSLLRLQAMSRRDRRRVSAEIKRNPMIVEEFAQELAGLASRGGASLERRFHLRSLLKQVTWRLTHQPLDAVLADVIEKTKAQEALIPDPTPPKREGPWAHATERLWSAFAPAETDGEGTDYKPSISAGSDLPLAQSTPGSAASLRQKAEKRALTGLGLLAGGLALVGLASLLGAGSNPAVIVVGIGGLVVLTAAVVLLVMALVTVLVAASMAQRELAQRKLADEGSADDRVDEPSPRAAADDPFPGRLSNGEASLSVVVSTTEGWVDLGISLRPGSVYALTAVPAGSDAWSAVGSPGVLGGPGSPAPDMPLGAVIARVGGTVLLVGSSRHITGLGGALYVAVNEPLSAEPKRFSVTVLPESEPDQGWVPY